MNIIKKINLLIQKIFSKQDEIKKLQKPKETIKQDRKEGFIQALKINTSEIITKKKVETLTCNGDGLGIQKRMTS